MIKKLRIRLYFLFELFLILFFGCITILYLNISYQALYEKSYLTFQQNSIAINNAIQTSYVVDKTILSAYLDNSYEIYISKDGTFYSLKSTKSKQDWSNTYKEVLKQGKHTGTNTDGINNYPLFTYTAKDGQKYFATIFHQSNLEFTVVVLHSQNPFGKEFKQVVKKYLLVSICAILLLSVLAFIFLNKMIDPIAISTKRQKEFIDAASHELRTPLTLIKSSLFAMHQSTGVDAEKYYQVADSECTRMSTLLGDLLTLSRIDGQRWSMNLENQHIEPVIFQCYNNFEDYIMRNGLSLFIDLPEEPIAPYYFDKERILQIFTILMDNAIQYTKKGSITLRAYEQGHHLFLCVADTGVGIEQEEQEKIFDRFYQVNKGHTDSNHFGLGLSIAKEIVTLHGGTIRVFPTPGGGATFEIKL